MNYLWIWVLLMASSHYCASGLVTKRLRIKCTETNFDPKSTVEWHKRQGLSTWNYVATGRFDARAVIDDDWKGRANVRMVNNSIDRRNIRSILEINNWTSSDNGMYRCRYRKLKKSTRTSQQLITVNALDVTFSPAPRQVTIEEGRTLSITAELPPDSGAKNMRWSILHFSRLQLGLTLTVKGIQQNHTGIYYFYYSIGSTVDFLEFFYITVKPRPTTKTTTTIKRTPAISPTLPPKAIVPGISSSRPTTHAASSTNVSLSENTTANVSAFTSTADPSDPVTPALDASEAAKDMETPTLIGIIFGAVLGTIILAVILILILGRTGKLPHSCRKLRKDMTQGRSDNQNVPRNVNDVYDNIQNQYADPNETYTDLTLPANSAARPAHTTFLGSKDVQPVRNDYLTVTETVHADHQTQSVRTDYVTPTESQPTDTYYSNPTETQPNHNEPDRTDYLTVTETQPIGIVHPTPIQGEPDSADYLTQTETPPIRTDYLNPLEMDPIHTESAEYVNYIPTIE